MFKYLLPLVCTLVCAPVVWGQTVDPETLDALVDAALADGYTYEKLGELCDTVGHRLTGFPGMKAIAWSVRSMREAGFDSVWTEPVDGAYWTRGREWARCAPVEFELDMLGWASATAPGRRGIEAEVHGRARLGGIRGPRRRSRRQDRALQSALGGLRQDRAVPRQRRQRGRRARRGAPA